MSEIDKNQKNLTRR